MRLFFPFIAGLLIVSCTQSITGPSEKNILPHNPMILIPARGKAIALGNQESARGWVRFSYSFFISQKEISRGDYFKILYGQSHIERADHPMTNISFYDALLFCNALSRQAGLDTVYTYTAVQRDHDGLVIGISDLVIHLDRDGFRLPTEAEWTFAAGDADFPWGNSIDSATHFAWYNQNSQQTPHAVAGKHPTRYHLYDMAGNAMEWTQDWWAPLRSDTLKDYAGSSTRLPLQGIVVKGGSYAHDLSFLFSRKRTDVYATTPETRRNYIGFRVCRGAITNPTYLSDTSASFATQILVSLTDIRQFTGSAGAKLVYVRSDSALILVDWNRFPPRESVIQKSLEIHNPQISPDGQWVAFSTRGEGQRGPSLSYIQSLIDSQIAFSWEGALPRWWVQASDTFIVYTSSAISNQDFASWSAEKTYRRSFSRAVLGEPQLLSSRGAFHGGLSRSGRLLVTGNTHLRSTTLPQDSVSLWFPYQICNVSLSPGPENMTAFLDFGSASTSITGKPYGIHAYLFLADTSGTIRRYFLAPRPYRGFSHPEWTTQYPFLVSNLFDSSETNTLIALFDLSRETHLQILRTSQHNQEPHLWLSPNRWIPVTPNDSAGDYNNPPLYVEQEILANKLRLLWLSDRSLIRLAALGDSRIMYGLRPDQLPFSAYNFAVSNCGWQTAFELARNYILRHLPSLKIILINLAISQFAYGDFSWDNYFTHDRGIAYDRNHAYWPEGVSVEFLDAVLKKSNNDMLRYLTQTNGFAAHESRGWNSEKVPLPELVSHSVNFSPRLRELRELIDSCAARDIHLIGAIMPENPLYLRTPHYDHSGLSDSLASVWIDSLRALETAFPNFHLLDEHRFGDHPYTDIHAYDHFHLSAQGAALFTQRLKVYLDSLSLP